MQRLSETGNIRGLDELLEKAPEKEALKFPAPEHETFLPPVAPAIVSDVIPRCSRSLILSTAYKR